MAFAAPRVEFQLLAYWLSAPSLLLRLIFVVHFVVHLVAAAEAVSSDPLALGQE
jgi:hypothetical protein